MTSQHVNTTIQFWKTHAPSTRLAIATSYSQFFKIPSFIAGMEICDIIVIARSISSRAFIITCMGDYPFKVITLAFYNFRIFAQFIRQFW